MTPMVQMFLSGGIVGGILGLWAGAFARIFVMVELQNWAIQERKRILNEQIALAKTATESLETVLKSIKAKP